MRKGKEFYNKIYSQFLELAKKGASAKEISKSLNISYSTAYAWLVKKRKPKNSALMEFRNFLRKNGPTAASELKKKIPKHNEFYHISSKRGLGIRRMHIKGLRLGQYAYWYYLDGQEELLKKRIKSLVKKYKKAKEKIIKTIEF
ncbi:MAG: hypothetical protein B6U68_03030 [Candidatus Aenigmarchaeota archaeon ex4484_14]|nr:hypothetical protein [Candidatus Aenigmarchaeota archaeon]OYT56602.1 MAG: hypothetical protein B6U68_03030 [Candidatus Aenigmarchaeota archaeon ex4484_14]